MSNPLCYNRCFSSRCLQILPRCLQMPPRCLQMFPRCLQMPPRWFQMPPDASRCYQMPPNSSFWHNICCFWHFYKGRFVRTQNGKWRHGWCAPFWTYHGLVLWAKMQNIKTKRQQWFGAVWISSFSRVTTYNVFFIYTTIYWPHTAACDGDLTPTVPQ